MGHFGEVLQGRLGPQGPVVLVTLPCPAFRGRASFRPRRGAPVTAAEPLAAAAARTTLRALGLRGWGGAAATAADAPRGGGAGGSTLCALATVRAVADAFGAQLTPETAAALCLAVEGASDPLMFSAPGRLLWASRAGAPLARAAAPPAARVVGGFDGPGRRTDPRAADFADVSDLTRAWAEACADADLPAWAAAATESAARNQPRAPKPRWGAVRALAAELGALGVVAAHTGSGLGLLFAPLDPAADRAAPALSALGLRRIVDFRTAPRS